VTSLARRNPDWYRSNLHESFGHTVAPRATGASFDKSSRISHLADLKTDFIGPEGPFLTNKAERRHKVPEGGK
jgi:hypothetical protein